MATYEERVQAKMAEMIAAKEEMEIIDEAKRRLAKAELQRMREDWIAHLIANPHPEPVIPGPAVRIDLRRQEFRQGDPVPPPLTDVPGQP
jgi:hypothetical protein